MFVWLVVAVIALLGVVSLWWFWRSRSCCLHSIVSLIGKTRKDIRSKFGAPDRSSEDFDSYFASGLVFDYQKGRVVGITASRMISGRSFQGEILGIRLGDPKSKCLSVWGRPFSEHDSGFEYSKVFWKFKGYRLELEVWNRDGADENFGAYKKGTVKRIVVAK